MPVQHMYAYSTLIMCCVGVPFSLVNEAKTDALPDGDAKLAWKALKDKYQLENAASKIELKKQFAQNKMNKQDPDERFMQLDHLRNRLHSMKSTIQDEDYVAHILSNLAEEYSELVTVLEVELETITVDKLKERVRGFY